MTNSFYLPEELDKLGFKKYGNNVLISRKTSIYTPEKITLGDNVRIDDFSILSGNIAIGSYVHISAYCALYGKYGIIMENFTGLSPRCTVFSATDDFSGEFLIGPILAEEFTNICGGTVIIKRFSQIGASSVILPAVIIEEGTAVGAMSLVNRNLEEWGIYAGIPAKRIKKRLRGLLKLVEKI